MSNVGGRTCSTQQTHEKFIHNLDRKRQIGTDHVEVRIEQRIILNWILKAYGEEVDWVNWVRDSVQGM
jgi:hypothetical protein